MAEADPKELHSVPGPGYWRMVGEGEPFRLLFPVGVFLGILGAALWPIHVLGFSAYPALSHSRIMIEGFLASFVMGFLGTAMPRMLDASPLALSETVAFAVALVATGLLHFFGLGIWGDGLFLATLGFFVCALLQRFLRRRDMPPPSFVLVAMGLASGLLGTVLQIAAARLSPAMTLFGRLLLHQGFLFLPVMGVGAFMFPRFVGLPNRQDFPESRTPPPGWLTKAAWAAMAGCLVWAGYLIEAVGDPRTGIALRAVMVAVYLSSQVPFQQARIGKSSLALGLCLALVSILLGHALMAVFPGRMVSWLHVVFITGFGMLALIVACRVVYGHGGHSEKFQALVKPVLVLIGLVILAMLTRVAADWMPESRMRHLSYAALAWIAGAVVWFVALRKTLARSDED